MNLFDDYDAVERIALINGIKVYYYMCSDRENTSPKHYPERNLWYIGTGTIYSINGVVQTSEKARHFWAKGYDGLRQERNMSIEQLLQNLEPETLARVINDVSYHDPEFYKSNIGPLVENLWWLEDEEIYILARYLATYSTEDLIESR
jgi:hypothetical protein